MNSGILLYILVYSDIFRIISICSGDLVSKNTPPQPVLFAPNYTAIFQAWASTSTSKSVISKASNMTTKTFAKCLRENTGNLVFAKANGLVNGLNACGAKPPVTFEMLFTAVPPKSE